MPTKLSILVRFTLPACAALLSGCGAYLHNPGRATATSDLQTKFGALSTPAYFDAQDKNLADFATREDEAVAELLVSSRDYRLLNVIKPDVTVSDPTATPGIRLTRLVNGDLEASYGTSALDAEQARSLMTSRYTKDLAVRTTSFNDRRIATTVRSYRAAGGALPTGCDAVLASVASGAPPLSHPTPAQANRYERLVEACRDRQERSAAAADCDPSMTAGNLGAVCQSIAELADDQARRKSQLADAERALKEAGKSTTPEDESKGEQQAIDFLDSLGDLSSDERLTRILQQIDAVLGSELERSLGNLDDKENVALPEASQPLINALKLIGAIRDYEVARAARPLDQPSALLIGLAKVRHDRNLIAIDIDEADQREALLLSEAGLIRTQLHYLARAQQALCGRTLACGAVLSGRSTVGSQQLDEALSYYVFSQNVGAMPFEILRFRDIQVQRAAALNRARVAEADFRALLKPAIDQIAAYGAGGIKPETLADFIAGLPVAGSILVK